MKWLYLRPLSHFIAQNDNLQVHEEKNKGVYVKNLSDYYVSSANEVYEIMRQGGAARVVTSTSTSYFITPSSSLLLYSVANMLNARTRHERRVLSIAFRLPNHDQPAQHRDGRSEDR